MAEDAAAPVRNEAEERFELRKDGHLAFLTYLDEGDRLLLLHTDVPPELEGHGVGSSLVQAAVEAARAAGQRVVPFCPFARAWLRRHREYADVIAPTDA